MLTASKARLISTGKFVTSIKTEDLKKILKEVSKKAKCGGTCIIYPHWVSKDTLYALQGLGYKAYHSDSATAPCCRVSWGL